MNQSGIAYDCVRLSAPKLLEALELVADSTAVLNHLPPESIVFICEAIAEARGKA